MHTQGQCPRQLLAVATALLCLLRGVVSQLHDQPPGENPGGETEDGAGAPSYPQDSDVHNEEAPAWIDEAFIEEQQAAKDEASRLLEAAGQAHEDAKKAAVAFQQAKIAADEAQQAIRLKAERAEEAFRRKADPIDAPTSHDESTEPDESNSCGPNGDCGNSRLLSDVVSEPPSVSLITISHDSDLLPLELMLPHQVSQSSKEGRERLERVLVLKMPPSPHQTSLKPGAVPFSMVPLRATGDRDGADEVIQVDAESLNDDSLFKQFLRDDSKEGVSNLQGLWRDGSMTAVTNVDESVFQHSTVALAMLTAIKECNTTYCAIMEPDVFVHRHADQDGWIDRAVKLMEADPKLVVVQAARLRGSEMAGSCSTEQSPDGSFSQRYFMLHRQRLNKLLPIAVDCAPRCDTFEAFFMLPKVSVGHMHCSSTAAWVIHPPENELSLMRLFEGCAHSAGRGKELQGLKTGGRHLSEVPIPAVPKEHENDEHILKHFRRLSISSWVGLPEFLDRVTSSHDFGSAKTISVGEQIHDDLGGWTCPQRK